MQAIKINPTNAESHFRLGVLNWEMGESETTHAAGREEVLNAINLDVSNKDYVEYLFAHILPQQPTYLQIKGGVDIYTDTFAMPYFTASSNQVSQPSIAEVHAPANVAKGTAAIKLTWNKASGTWASFIVGFDKDITNTQKALSGNLASLGGLDSSNLNKFAITSGRRAKV